ncbi:YggS family pyridoxal phosphate-dependent enzyme [Glaciecola sp. 2405UD65-10]|uniref:YggS family pyridoxal phosphate-dependent enzyme n=1 Tax=Glaciecola sp. 2405UD65-10 TaxID=3397244 RepID=UPI003B5B6444
MATNNSNIASKLQAVNNNISASAAAYNRDVNSIQLLAVSKTKPVSDIVTAYEAQHRHFGENYVQEAVDKIQQLKDLSQLCWHFIGPLQSNKSKFIAEYFDWMHSLDRLKIAKRLNEQRSIHQKPLQVCVQVNIDDENSKAGIAPSEVLAFVEQLQSLEKIQCRGLMTIPKAGVSATEREASFAQMQQLFTQCQEKFPNFDTLSMGMSDDMDLAIKYGATIVRIGTGIFGSRN